MVVGNNNFARVREAFCSNLAENLRRLNVAIKSPSPKGDWLQINCPFCSDTSGSASVSVHSGHLRCHQCSAKEDLFTWVGKSIGATEPWLQCQAIAKLVGVEVVGSTRQKQLFRTVPEMTAETWSEMRARLYEDKECEMPREFLRRRGLLIHDKLEELPIGAFGGKLIFAQHNEDGKLLKRCRVYDPFPAKADPKWIWNRIKGQTGRTIGFWPIIPRIMNMEPDRPLVIVEGEFDCMAAILKLGALDKQTMVMTWTGGGGSAIPPDAIHPWMRNRDVHFIYDNDVFQGISGDVAPDEKKRDEMKVRKKTLLEVSAPNFAANRCNVFIRAITLDPMAHWGGDLRDMIDSGLQSFEELPIYKLAECRKSMREAVKVSFVDVHKHLNEYVELRCQVAAVADDVSIKMQRAVVRCPKGEHAFCAYCKIPEIAPNGVIDFSGMQAELACAMTDVNVVKHLMERVGGKPNSCKTWNLAPLTFSDGARWTAMAREDDDKEGARTVEVLSDAPPPMSGELLLRGWLYISANGLTPVLMCDHLEASDAVAMPIEPHRLGIIQECGGDTDNPDVLDSFLDRWALDVANHTTHIYGRRDMHVAIALVAHSALWMEVLGQRRRAWMDICLIGATRTGKSASVRAYLKALGVGQHVTPMGNYSRPGLTLGTVSLNGQQKMKPGVFPRNHGKMLAIDEAHLMLAENGVGGGLFPILQGARDIGKVEGLKISGSQTLNAAVRLIAIANWLDGNKHSHSTPAQHLLALYGTPESLARLDFGLPIDEVESGVGPDNVLNYWTQERQRCLVIRAWKMTSSDIVFRPDAVEEAVRLCKFVWKDKYSEELPLFTEKEKVYSVLRIAIAIANMTLSHPDGEVGKCLVRLVHVQWAARWLERTWKLLEYEAVSRTRNKMMDSRLVWRVEALFTVSLGLHDPTAVGFVLGKFFGTLTKDELKAVTGLGFIDFEKWITSLVRAGALDVIKVQGYGSQIGLRFTKGAIEIIQKLVLLAENASEGWASRQSSLNMWFGGGSGLATPPPGLLPIDAPLEAHINAMRQQRRFDDS